MDDELKGTPNPLNPTPGVTPLDANPSEPIQPAESTNSEWTEPTEPINSEPASPEPTEPISSENPESTEPAPVESESATEEVPVHSMHSARPNQPIDMVKPTTSGTNQPETTQSNANQFDTTPPSNSATLNNPAMPGNSTIPNNPTAPMGVVENLDPTNRPMERAPMPEVPQPKKNKKKIGFIVGGIVCLFLAIGCGVAAVLLFMNHGDPVERAMGKLMSGEAPTITTIQGTIDTQANDLSSSISDLRISVNSNMVTDSLINSSTATLDGTLRNGGNFSLNLSEIYAANNDLFLKIDGISEMSSDPYLLSNDAETTNGNSTTEGSQAGDEVSTDEGMALNEGTNSAELATGILKLFSTIDGKWIRVPLSNSETTSSESTPNTFSATSCSAKLLLDIHSNRNSVMEMYQRNAFIGSTTKDLAVTSVTNPIYKVVIKGENFTNFYNELIESSMLKEYQDCTGKTLESLNANSVDQTLAEMPEVYVEIDENDNFTRLYFVTDTDEGDATVTTDLNFSYPTNVNVAEPTEYTDLSEIFQGLSLSTYDATSNGLTVEGQAL